MFRAEIVTIDPISGKYAFTPPKLDADVEKYLTKIAHKIIEYFLAVHTLYPDYFTEYLAKDHTNQHYACHERLFTPKFAVNATTIPNQGVTLDLLSPTIFNRNYIALMFQLPIGQLNAEVFAYIKEVITVFFDPILKHNDWNKFTDIAFKGLTAKERNIALDKMRGAFCFYLESRVASKVPSGHSDFIAPICNNSFSDFQECEAFLVKETESRIKKSIDTAFTVQSYIEFSENEHFVSLIPKNLARGLGELFGDQYAELPTRKQNFDALGAHGHVILNERLCSLATELKNTETMSPTRALALQHTCESILLHLDNHYNPTKTAYLDKCSRTVAYSVENTCLSMAKTDPANAEKFKKIAAAIRAYAEKRTAKKEHAKKEKAKKEKKSFFKGLFSSHQPKVNVDQSAALALTDSSSSSSLPSPRTS